MADSTHLALTPTEDLILDVLVARFRLGDTLWTFDSRNKRVLRAMEDKRLVNLLSPVVPRTVRAMFTDQALHTFGAQWFRLAFTLDVLPYVPQDGSRGDRWTRQHLQTLIDLPQAAPDTGAGAINAAHLLIIRMIQRQHPAYRVSAGGEGSVHLTGPRGNTIEISSTGQIIKHHRPGTPSPKVTDSLLEALGFPADQAW